jgi:hypothetical protein
MPKTTGSRPPKPAGQKQGTRPNTSIRHVKPKPRRK